MDKLSVLGVGLIVVAGVVGVVQVVDVGPFTSPSGNVTDGSVNGTDGGSMGVNTSVMPSASVAMVEENVSTEAAKIQVIEPENVDRVRVETADGQVLRLASGERAVVDDVDEFVTILELDTRTDAYDVSNGQGEIVVIGVGAGGEEVVLERTDTLNEEDRF